MGEYFLRDGRIDLGHKAPPMVQGKFYRDSSNPVPILQQRVIAVANALLNNPFLSSSDLALELGLSREQLADAYVAMQRYPALLDLMRTHPQVLTSLKIQDILFKNPANLARILQGEETAPLIVEFHTLGPCGNQCRHCYNIRHGYQYDRSATLKKEDYLALIAELTTAGTQSINFSGGLEPLSDRQALPAIERAIQNGLGVTIFTTGLHLTRKIRPMVIEAERIRISMYGTNADNYLHFARCRNSNTFNAIIKNIRETVALKQKTGSKVSIGICMIVVKDNFRELKAMVELAYDLGVDTVVIRAQFGKNIQNFTQDELDEIARMLAQIQAKESQGQYGNLFIDIGESFYFLSEQNRFHPQTIISAKPLSTCYATRLKIGLDPWGHIFPCALITQPGVNQGNLSTFMIGMVKENPAGIISAHQAFLRSYPTGFPISFCRDAGIICNDFEGNTNAWVAKFSEDLSFGIPLEQQPFFHLYGAE